LADGAQQMLECEAYPLRTWLRKGYASPERIEDLRALIAKKRGQAGAEKLIEEMRRQWRRRAEWLS